MIRIDGEDYGPEWLEEAVRALDAMLKRQSDGKYWPRHANTADYVNLSTSMASEKLWMAEVWTFNWMYHAYGRGDTPYSALSAALAEARLPGVEVGDE